MRIGLKNPLAGAFHSTQRPCLLVLEAHAPRVQKRRLRRASASMRLRPQETREKEEQDSITTKREDWNVSNPGCSGMSDNASCQALDLSFIVLQKPWPSTEEKNLEILKNGEIGPN